MSHVSGGGVGGMHAVVVVGNVCVGCVRGRGLAVGRSGVRRFLVELLADGCLGTAGREDLAGRDGGA